MSASDAIPAIAPSSRPDHSIDPPSLMSALRAATQAGHERVESLTRLAEPDLTRAEYASVLRAFQSVYRPLERGLAAAEWTPLPAVTRTAALENDLRWLDPSFNVRHIEDAAVPSTPDAASVVGAMYVLEGASLGARILVPMLRERLKLDGEGLAFFTASAADAATRWPAFRKAVAERSWSAEESNAACAAACGVFDAFATALLARR